MNEPEQRWPVQPIHRQAVVQRMATIVANRDSDPKDAVAASRALIAADAQNQADAHNANPQQHEHYHTVQLEAKERRDIILKNPEFLEFLYQQQMEKQANATAIEAVPDDRGDDERGRTNGNGKLPGTNGSQHH